MTVAKVEVKFQKLDTETGKYDDVTSLDDVRKLRVDTQFDSRLNAYTVWVRDTNEYV